MAITISVCMIVKNEEAVLDRCLQSLADLVDEINIIDTGSVDRTKEIAKKYTDRIFDFAWIGDFSAARNYAFSKATREYIYSADADEVLDEENRRRFRLLKENLLPEIDIVQMKYGNQLDHGTVYNFDEEYRPKLFRRVRSFVWEEPVHEQVRLFPVVYDSDIVITHKPHDNHSDRDLAIFRKTTENGMHLSKRLHTMYAKELFLAGTEQDFLLAKEAFTESALAQERGEDEKLESFLVLAHAARVEQDFPAFLKYITKINIMDGCSEGCVELGRFYEEQGDWEEASTWYYNAAYETKPVLKKACWDKEPLEALARICRQQGLMEQALVYEEELNGRQSAE